MLKTKSLKDKPESSDGVRILVSRYSPRKPFKLLRIDRWMKCLGPSPELLRDWKEGKVTEQEYEGRYRDEMGAQQHAVEELVNLSCCRDVTLLCFELEGEFCHRHILADIISETIEKQEKKDG